MEVGLDIPPGSPALRFRMQFGSHGAFGNPGLQVFTEMYGEKVRQLPTLREMDPLTTPEVEFYDTLLNLKRAHCPLFTLHIQFHKKYKPTG